MPDDACGEDEEEDMESPHVSASPAALSARRPGCSRRPDLPPHRAARGDDRGSDTRVPPAVDTGWTGAGAARWHAAHPLARARSLAAAAPGALPASHPARRECRAP